VTTLKQKWSAFWEIIFDPWNAVLTTAVGGLFYLSLQKAFNTATWFALSSIQRTHTEAMQGTN